MKLMRILWWRKHQECPRTEVDVMGLVILFIVLMINFKDMSILAWNVCGFASKKSNQHMKELIRRFKPDLIFLFETHIPFKNSARFLDKLGYDCVAVEECR